MRLENRDQASGFCKIGDLEYCNEVEISSFFSDEEILNTTSFSVFFVLRCVHEEVEVVTKADMHVSPFPFAHCAQVPSKVAQKLQK